MGKIHKPGTRQKSGNMLHLLWHINAIGPLPGMIAGAAWHTKLTIAAELAAFVALVHLIRRFDGGIAPRDSNTIDAARLRMADSHGA